MFQINIFEISHLILKIQNIDRYNPHIQKAIWDPQLLEYEGIQRSKGLRTEATKNLKNRKDERGIVEKLKILTPSFLDPLLALD